MIERTAAMSRNPVEGSRGNTPVLTTDVQIGSAPQSAWDSLNVLTFDGGGVKGYYSLLQLQKLMNYVKIAEEEFDKEDHDNDPKNPGSSFSPCEEPTNISHSGSGKYTRYLPCHYFDYIAGTSTGALITIMLARLRMPVEDCLAEYENFGGMVFANPRVFHKAGKRAFIPLLCTKTKFKTSDLEEAIKDVIRRRGDFPNEHDDAMSFTTPKGLCRAIVLVNIEGKLTSGQYFLFRSYDHFFNRVGPAARGGTSVQGPKNPGCGTRFAAWKVARAATAAKLYFEPLVFDRRDGDIVQPNRQREVFRKPTGIFGAPKVPSRMSSGLRVPTLPGNGARAPENIHLTDAGYGPTNNPSTEVLSELRFLMANRNKKINTWVSVGTARKSLQPKGKKSYATSGVVAEGLHNLGDTEKCHENMQRESQKKGAEGFDYFRLNEPDALSMEMDEWKVRGKHNETLKTIQDAFHKWASDVDITRIFGQCAEALVRNRRERVKNEARWQRYALGNFYVCGEENCSYDCDQTWNYRDEFERHLEEHHNMEGRIVQTIVRRCEQRWVYKASHDVAEPEDLE